MAISKLNVGGNSYDLRDAASMHYIGHATAGITESSGVYTSQGLTDISVTIAVNDFITYGASNLNYVCTNVDTSTTPATQTWALISEAAAKIPVKGVEVNGTALTPDTKGIVDIPAATNAAFGVVKTGTNITNTSGVISVADATTTGKGVVQIGSNINVNNGEISVPTADAASTQDGKFGVVKTGANITNTNGVISVADAAVGTKGVVDLVGLIGDSATAATDKAPTEKAVADALAAMPEPMVFRGTLGSLGSGATIQALPVDGSAKKGDTYKVITAGTYDSHVAKIGDTFICNEKTGTAPSGTNTWVLIPSGDEPDGTVTSVGVDVATGTKGLTIVTSEGAGNPITTSGTITVGIESGYQLLSDADKAKVDTIGKSAPVYNSVTASQTAAQTNSVAPARVGTNTGVDDDTLYIDFLNFDTADVVGEATS